MATGVNISGPNLKTGTNIVTLTGFDPAETVTFSKPLAAASGGLLLWDAWSAWPTDAGTGTGQDPPVLGQTWDNELWIYGNNGGADVLLFHCPSSNGGNLRATEAEAFADLAALMPVSFSGYTTYKVVGVADPNPPDNRNGLSILVEGGPGSGGVLFPQFSPEVTLTAGTEDPDYPVENLADAVQSRLVFRADAGVVSLELDLGAEEAVRMIGFAQHNADAAATFRVRLYDAGAALVHDSGVLDFFPGAAGPVAHFLQTTPYVMDAPAGAQTAVIDLSSHADGWEIGAVLIGGWWAWPNISVPREIGIRSTDLITPLSDSVDAATAQWAPRTFAGQRFFVDLTEEEDTIDDFHRAYRTHKPFIYVWDYGDPETWPRECALVTNRSIIPVRRGEYPSGKFAFDLEEHIG